MKQESTMEIINTPNLLGYVPQSQSSSLEKGSAGGYAMVRSERTAGFIPSYDSFFDTAPAQDNVISQDEAFEKIVQEQLNPQDNTYSLTLDEHKLENGNAQESKSRFSLFDFLDMINPLQHIPVVNYAYRYLTGDDIKPISSIIGGAVFGGPVGAATGLVASVAEHEIGSPLPETVLSMASKEGTAAYKKYEGYKTSSKIDANYDFNT